jgi:hypothetical protein
MVRLELLAQHQEMDFLSLLSQGISFLVALNPTVVMDPEKCCLVPTGQGIYCLADIPRPA